MSADERALRLRRIADLHSEAIRLLAAATHETMKKQVQRASRDLDEAAQEWLWREPINPRPITLAMVDVLIEVANFRLQIVADILKERGPGASLPQ